MKTVVILLLLVAVFLAVKRLVAGPTLAPEDAEGRVASGAAVLIDVREPSECAAGVAAPALLLPLSDLRGTRALWGPALEAHRGRELILYCASGARSGLAASLLRSEGHRVANAGSYGAWRDAGLPVRQP